MGSKILDVYLHGIFAGELCQETSGKLSFTYSQDYLASQSPALSLSLPLQEMPFPEQPTRAFFSGLLPDSFARYRLARYLGISEHNPFAMLKAIGVECAGAISVHPRETDISTDADRIEIIDDHKLFEILDLLKRHPLLTGQDGIRLSLAGAQDKLAVGLQEGKIALMKGSLPTSHLLKPLIEGVHDSVQNEFFCMRLAKHVGIEVPDVEIRYTEKTPYYLVERYDRSRDNDGKMVRIHQEDFCQALGIYPENKYENEGGPTFAQCQNVLKNYSAEPGSDQMKMLKRMIFNYLIANSDAHAKNFSLLYHHNKPILAPAYDLLCTEIYPGVTGKMAMKIGGRYKPYEVCLRHWHRIVPDTAVARSNIEKQLKQMAEECIEKSQQLKETLIKDGFSSDIYEGICEVIQKRATHIKLTHR